jgi:hypothetical protein
MADEAIRPSGRMLIERPSTSPNQIAKAKPVIIKISEAQSEGDCEFPQSSGAGWWLPRRWPVDRDHANTDERHPNFRLDVGQEIGNPPRGIGVPINQRRISRRKISVAPEGRPHDDDDPSNDN